MGESWTEGDSKTFLRDAGCFVPERELLIESACRLIPTESQFDLVDELCCGNGRLNEAILERLDEVRLLALDASDTMLEA